MQWFKSAMVVTSVVCVAALAATTEGCSSNKASGDAGTDAKITDAKVGTDGKVPTDGGGTICPSSDPACENCDTSGFTPIAQGTPITKAAQCAPADITAFVTKCLSGTTGTSTDCQAWQTAEQTSAPNCLSCVFTEQTTTAWGVLVCTSAGCSLNIPGCLDVALGQKAQENSTSTGSCGDYLSASYGCQDNACSACSTTDFDTCASDAVAAECKTYADAFTNASVCSSLQGDNPPQAVNTCFPQSQTGFTDAEYNAFTNVFCGQ